MPPEARIGTWVFEWYWKQPGLPHVDEFVADVEENDGKVPTARTWFGYVTILDLRARAKGEVARCQGGGQGAEDFNCRRRSR